MQWEGTNAVNAMQEAITNKLRLDASRITYTPDIDIRIRSSDNMGMNEYLRNLADKIDMERKRGLSTPYSSIYRWAMMTGSSTEKNFTPKKIIRSGPVTVIFWADDTKTLVRRTEGAPDDPYLAFCAGLAKKVYGNNSKVKKLIEEKTVEPKERKKEEKDHD